jgi:hypothetical protein
MKKLVCAALAAGFVVSASSLASAQGFSAVSLLWHSSVISHCEGRELTQQEAQGTAIGWSSMWQAMRDCEANRAKRAAAADAAQKRAAAAKPAPAKKK